jgi:Holliday junction resolvase RusA-like endonuclease
MKLWVQMPVPQKKKKKRKKKKKTIYVPKSAKNHKQVKHKEKQSI